MTGVERWIEHSPMSDSSDFAVTLTRLPSDIDAINRTIQGLLIHTDWLTAYGVKNPSARYPDKRCPSRSAWPPS
jgi:hypothetical protein